MISCRSALAATQRIASAPTSPHASTTVSMFPPVLWNSSHGAFPKLLLAPDHEEVPIRARVEGEREAPVTLAADVPVAHVVEPVVHSPAGRRRDPRHLRGGGLQPRPELLHRDEPFVVDAEDD